MRRVLLSVGALVLCLPAAAADARPTAVGPATAGAAAPLPASDYAVRSVCTAPAPGHAGCLALRLVPRTQAELGGALYAAGQKPEPLFPGKLHSAYNLPTEPAAGSATQTIALVDAYNDPGAEADLEVYDHLSAIKLPECDAGDGCFEKVNQQGESAAVEGASSNPFPKSAEELTEREATCKSNKQSPACAEVEEAVGWTVEISTDLDVAHSICQSCHILLVEADSSSYEDLEAAEETAAKLGATEISNSWGGSEPPFDSPAFNVPGVVITAAAGDDGYLNWTEAAEAGANGEEYFVGADYPASSPDVVAVGGTELTVTKAGARKSETVWNEDPDPEGGNEGAGGGGCSTQFEAPSWQREVPDWDSVGCGTGTESKRAVADVAADADPFSGVLVYDSEESTEYFLQIGGTSVASPIIASAFALAGGSHGVEYPAQTLYSRLGSPAGFPSLYDVIEGGNGKCDGSYTLGGCTGSMSPLSPFDCGKGKLICNAAPGYDGPTGVGTPDGVAAFEPESHEEHLARVAAEEAEAKAATERKAEEERKAAEAKKAAEKKAEEERKARAAEEEKRAAEKKLQEEEARLGSTGGSTGGGGGTTSGGSGTGTGQAVTGSSGLGGGGLGGSLSGAGTGRGGSSNVTVHLSRLALTAHASAAIARGLATAARVAFAFSLNAPAHVQVTLSRQIRAHGRLRWASTPGAFTLNAAAGRDRAHLRGRSTLPPGRYRLTLTPAHGRGQAIVFVLR
jgi:hypothetical protein